jgi:pyruvate/2-oxoglutarate dehydrogenase complex dihydrolipoamide acyltransferase (E2) component
MTASIIMPQLGETVAEGKIVAWYKSVGDKVVVGDRLFEVETDKVTIDVEATEAGLLSEIRVGKDQTVKVGTVVAVLNGAAASAAPRPLVPSPAAKPAATLSAHGEVTTAEGQFGKARSAGDVRVSPLARRAERP